ncbi:hypothetical protein ATANTOWER_026144 [Ataeniobius toweri]|uniref:Uncharacterized protein n=1 Tax=Ataeniobius toweri TaxID=208326 RepID=A0ABU7BIB0_9TELE|nr:hypothetical protein [Ataeniobius toweri]
MTSHKRDVQSGLTGNRRDVWQRLKLTKSANQRITLTSLPGLKIALPSLFLHFSVYINTRRGEGSTSGLATQPSI